MRPFLFACALLFFLPIAVTATVADELIANSDETIQIYSRLISEMEATAEEFTYSNRTLGTIAPVEMSPREMDFLRRLHQTLASARNAKDIYYIYRNAVPKNLAVFEYADGRLGSLAAEFKGGADFFFDLEISRLDEQGFGQLADEYRRLKNICAELFATTLRLRQNLYTLHALTR